MCLEVFEVVSAAGLILDIVGAGILMRIDFKGLIDNHRANEVDWTGRFEDGLASEADTPIASRSEREIGIEAQKKKNKQTRCHFNTAGTLIIFGFAFQIFGYIMKAVSTTETYVKLFGTCA